MKRLLIVFLLLSAIACLIAPTLCCAQAFAEQNYPTVTIHPNDYTLYAKKQSDGSYVVGFNGNFFGNSNIPVDVVVYSSAQTPIDFDITAENLAAEQAVLRDRLIGLFDDVRNYVNAVDEISNTNYNGVDYYVYGLAENPDATGTSDMYYQIQYLPKQSDVNAYNNASAGQTIQIDQSTYQMLEVALEMYAQTNGAFNPALYRLVDLWGFSSRTYFVNSANPLPYDRKWVEYQREINGKLYTDYYYPLPDQKYVDAFKQSEFIDFSDSFTLSEVDGNYYVTKNVGAVTVDGVIYQQWIDLGGIAKGFISDYIGEALRENGFDAFSINLGTSSQTWGDLSADVANIYMTDPNAKYDGYLFGLLIGGKNLSSSGLYERCYYVNGVRYAHIIDGNTGAPVQSGIEGLTLISNTLSAAELDCLTTAYTILGKNAIVDLANDDFAKQNDLQIVGVYQTIKGSWQILSNVDKNAVLTDYNDGWYSCKLDNYGWALNANADGIFVYDDQIAGDGMPVEGGYTTILVILAVALAIALFSVVTYFCIKGKYKVAKRLNQAKKDKFFKPVDAFVYLCVALVIVVLFSAFFTEETQPISTVSVVDMQTGEVLFVYNVARGEYDYLAENSRNWKIEVDKQSDRVVVELTQQVGSSQRYNQLTIDLSNGALAQMTDSICSTHQDCVRNFAPLTESGKSIVCSPNYLKVISE